MVPLPLGIWMKTNKQLWQRLKWEKYTDIAFSSSAAIEVELQIWNAIRAKYMKEHISRIEKISLNPARVSKIKNSNILKLKRWQTNVNWSDMMITSRNWNRKLNYRQSFGWHIRQTHKPCSLVYNPCSHVFQHSYRSNPTLTTVSRSSIKARQRIWAFNLNLIINKKPELINV